MWAGKLNLRAGKRLFAVEYDTEATAAAIRQGCAGWLDDADRDLPAVFGVRTAAVGLRRRRVGLIHHGAPIRHRTADLAGAVEALATIVTGIETTPAADETHVDARVLVRDLEAVLLVLPASVDLDDRALRKRRIEDAPVWRAVVDTATGEVLVGGRRRHVVALVVADALAGPSLDDWRRYLWARGAGDTAGWAALLDHRGQLIAQVPEDRAVSAVIDALA